MRWRIPRPKNGVNTFIVLILIAVAGKEDDAVGASGAGTDVAVEVQIKPRIERDSIWLNLNYMYLVVAHIVKSNDRTQVKYLQLV
jgi:hypothetical protein